MRLYFLILLLFFSSCSCNNENKTSEMKKAAQADAEILFDKAKWNTKKGASYPYREKMLNNVIYNDSLRTLKREAVIEYLGEPTRVQDEYAYYLIEKKKALVLTLTARTLVIKFNEDDKVEWMKIHE